MTGFAGEPGHRASLQNSPNHGRKLAIMTCAAPGNVLIADDDEDIRSLVLLTLRNAGFQAETVDGGVEALAAARRQRRKVVVLDVRMPDLSGLEVCRAIKSEGPTSDSQVLMISANSTMEDVAAGFAAGADDYLPKPFSPRELVQRVGMLLDRASAG